MSKYQLQSDGLYHIPIVDFGTRLRDNFGLTIKEHPAFGGVAQGVHSPTSYHYTTNGNAFDVQDWRGGPGEGAEGFDGVGYVQRTKNLRNLLKGIGVEVIGPGDMAGHDSHLHLATADGFFKLNQEQFDAMYGGKSGGTFATFEPGRTVEVAYLSDDEGNKASDAIVEARERTKSYSEMSKQELDAEYDRVRREDPSNAAAIGMQMHKDYFNK